ncbi:MAG: transcriptional regulator [Actinobacteria bacterium]|nr:transcriptional regulator [Actinomycetota bacterium]
MGGDSASAIPVWPEPELGIRSAWCGQLRVLGKFDLVAGRQPFTLGMSCQRLLTLLVVLGGHVTRARVAGMLWPDVASHRASANLRSVLWRLHRRTAGATILATSPHELRLHPGLAVDLHAVTRVAHRLLDRSSPLTIDELGQVRYQNLREDIVPTLGDEEWLVPERERHRQLRLHALEALSEQLIQVGWHGAAVEAALAVASSDPYRESARELLIRAYLAEGNHVEAQRQFLAYRGLLRAELGIDPSPRFGRVLAEAATAGGRWAGARPAAR